MHQNTLSQAIPNKHHMISRQHTASSDHSKLPKSVILCNMHTISCHWRDTGLESKTT
jgi:hypothetical protein